MGRGVRLFEGRFGRLVLVELVPTDQIQAQQSEPAIVVYHGAAEVLLLNPSEVHVCVDAKRALTWHPAGEWLRATFPAAFPAEDPKPFPAVREEITPRIRQLADTLAIEMLNDRFLSTERLEFMLQELMLSIVETYLAKKRA